MAYKKIYKDLATNEIFVGVDEIAKRIGRSTRTVQRRIRNGEIVQLDGKLKNKLPKLIEECETRLKNLMILAEEHGYEYK